MLIESFIMGLVAKYAEIGTSVGARDVSSVSIHS